MRKFNCILLSLVLFTFIVVSLGGCGGSGSSSSESGGGTTTDTPQSSLVKLLSSDMASVTESSEFVKLINEFEESGSGDKMNDHTWVYCVTDAEAQSLREKYQGDELSLAILEVLLFSADVVSRDYAKENDIMLIYPDEDYINRTLEAVGLPADYAMNDNENGDKRLEIFAIAKRTVNGRTFRFTYQAFKADDAVAGEVRVSDDVSVISQDYASSDVSGDVVFYYDENGNVIRSADVESKGKESVSTGTDDKTFFSVDRWRSYYNWCASLTEKANELSTNASAIELRAAADDDLTKISDAQNKTLDFDYYTSGYRPWFGNVLGDSVTINRTSQITFTVYNCHSFRYNCDYYLVQANTTTVPKNFQDREVTFTWIGGSDEFGRYGYECPVNYISGYTGIFGFESHISSLVNGKRYEDLTTDEVSLIRHIPTRVPKNESHSESMSWSIGGQVGISKSGPSVTLNNSVSHSTSRTWTTSDWDVRDQALQKKKASASWYSDITGPSDSGSWHGDLTWPGDSSYMGISATGASRGTLSFITEWIWQVDKSVWSKQDTETLCMEVDYFWEEGFCFGKGKWVGLPKGFSWNGGRRYPRWHKYDRVNLTMPGHSWVEQKTFDISANGDKSAGLGFSILSEGSWTVASDQNWITFTRSSGEATGDSQYPIRFQVAENNTGRPREATITFTAKVGDKITETSKLRVNQASK
ncbi:MAG: BACON domain-containing protein [Synergistaceae bacterium]|nr:BACON domain-containing protein [Synergistaceae bacterium]